MVIFWMAISRRHNIYDPYKRFGQWKSGIENYLGKINKTKVSAIFKAKEWWIKVFCRINCQTLSPPQKKNKYICNYIKCRDFSPALYWWTFFLVHCIFSIFLIVIVAITIKTIYLGITDQGNCMQILDM